MQTTGKPEQSTPVFPAPLSFPLRMIPSSIHNKVLVATLNRIFHKDLEAGELDFLQDRLVQITLEDAGVEFSFTLKGDKLVSGEKNRIADLILEGTVYNYLLLASRQEDTDSLFFSRRLHMQGDTELGLYVKNFLDGMELESNKIHGYLKSALQKSLPLYERLFG